MATASVQMDSSPVELKELEKKLIKSMAGCHTVDFKFAETFSPDSDYQFRDRYYEGAEEFVFIVEETEDKVSLQHLLRVKIPGKNGGPERDLIIKHWRQDWIYENQDLFLYNKDFEWRKTHLPAEAVKGTWTQKVYQVDDSPRYEAYGRWIHQQGRHYWDGIADAPLPRRDRTTREDYNVLVRDCRIEVFEDGGWLIDQDNRKVARDDDGKETLICMEKGLETFTPKNYDPAPLQAWWEKRADFWADARDLWEALRADEERIKFDLFVDEVAMYDAFFGLAEEFQGPEGYDKDAARAQIKAVLDRHVHANK